MSGLRTIIVEDHTIFREVLRSKVLTKTQCVIIGECSDGLQAVQQAKDLQPDLILMDLRLPNLNGVEAGRRILEISPSSKIVFLSQENSVEIAQVVLRLGAAAYLLKSDANELPLALEVILQGKAYISSGVKSD